MVKEGGTTCVQHLGEFGEMWSRERHKNGKEHEHIRVNMYNVSKA